MRFETKFPTIPLSGKVSEIVHVIGAKTVSVWCPLVTSCQILALGSFDPTSANFTRIQNSVGSGAWTYSAGVGSNCIGLEEIGYFPYLRFETTVNQAAITSLAVITQF